MASISDQNWIIWNQGKNPLVNFNFMLRVELAVDLPCKSVRAFQRELEYDYIQEGGLNDYVHMRRKPISRPFTLEVERYVGVDYIDPLPLGADLVLPVMLFVSRNHDQFIPGVVARTYVFTGCTVMKKTYGDLVADQSGLLVETTTIGYREMLCVDIPWSEAGDNIFASTPTVPTNAATIDKSAKDLKALAQNFYDQALDAKTRCDEEFSSDELEKLIEELEKALADLQPSVANGGALQKKMADADAARTGADGKTLHEAADALRIEANEKEKAVRGAQHTLEEKKRALQEAADALDVLTEEASQVEMRISDLENKIKTDTAAGEELTSALPENMKTPDSAASVLDDARSKFDDARGEANKAQDAYDDARRELREELDRAAARRGGLAAELERMGEDTPDTAAKKAELAEAEKAEQDAKNAMDNPADGSALAGLLAALDAANGKRNAAQSAVEAAEKAVRDHETVEALKAGVASAQEKLDAAKSRKDALSGEEGSAKSAKESAEGEVTSAQAEFDTAESTWKAAKTAADDATEKAAEADDAFNKARADYELALKHITPMQNSLTNLKTRAERTGEQKDACTEQHDLCKEENDKVQRLPDDPIADVNEGYEKVKKYAKQAVFHERQVRETKQYMDNAQSFIDEVKPLLKKEEDGEE